TGRQTSGGVRSRFLTHTLVVAQITLTFVLMVGAGLFVRSLFTLQAVDVGFRTANLLTMTVPLGLSEYPEPAARVAFIDRLTERLRSIPDVDSFTIALDIPTSGARESRLKVAGRDISGQNGDLPITAATVIGPGYFQALGLTLPRGREFTSADGAIGRE